MSKEWDYLLYFTSEISIELLSINKKVKKLFHLLWGDSFQSSVPNWEELRVKLHCLHLQAFNVCYLFPHPPKISATFHHAGLLVIPLKFLLINSLSLSPSMPSVMTQRATRFMHLCFLKFSYKHTQLSVSLLFFKINQRCFLISFVFYENYTRYLHIFKDKCKQSETIKTYRVQTTRELDNMSIFQPT